jgi:hypothetical protein
VLYAHLTNQNQYFTPIYTPEQYFCLQEFVTDYHEHFVDLGAYTGDTIENFIWKRFGNFDKIYAFDPMEKKL